VDILGTAGLAGAPGVAGVASEVDAFVAALAGAGLGSRVACAGVAGAGAGVVGAGAGLAGEKNRPIPFRLFDTVSASERSRTNFLHLWACRLFWFPSFSTVPRRLH
jgi:hypothetical protein